MVSGRYAIQIHLLTYCS